MPSILFAWELGRHFGHLLPFVPLATRLRRAGIHVVAALRDFGPNAEPLRAAGVPCLAAPLVPEGANSAPLNYSEILLDNGFDDPVDIVARAGYWRSLLQAVQARLLLASNAPTALLAARSLGIPAMLFATPFEVPPAVSPLPAMRDWEPAPSERLAGADSRVLRHLNHALREWGATPLNRLADLFDVDESRLIGTAELDHYRARPPQRFWGVPSAPGAAVEATGSSQRWPRAHGPRVMAYLRWQHAHTRAWLASLSTVDACCFVVCPDAPDGLAWPSHVAVQRVAIDDLDALMRETDLVVTHASFGTTTAALRAGRPLLLLPTQLEQYLLARRVSDELACAAIVRPDEPAPDFAQLTSRLLGDADLHRRSASLALLLQPDIDPIVAMSERVVQLLHGRE